MEESEVMCECCGGDCKLCQGALSDSSEKSGGFIELPEEITKMHIFETEDKNGRKVDCLYVNDKYVIIPTDDPKKPFKRLDDMNKDTKELLEAYNKISSTFDDFTQLIRRRVGYESWPAHCRIAGVDEGLLGPAAKPGEHISVKMSPSPEPVAIPDQSNIIDLSNVLPRMIISRVEDFGRAQEKLKNVLDCELFENNNKHNPFWHNDDPEVADKLDDIRMKLSCLSDNLWDLWSVLRNEDREI